MFVRSGDIKKKKLKTPKYTDAPGTIPLDGVHSRGGKSDKNESFSGMKLLFLSANQPTNSSGLHSNGDDGERGVDFRNIRMKDEKQTAALNFVAVNQLSRTARASRLRPPVIPRGEASILGRSSSVRPFVRSLILCLSRRLSRGELARNAPSSLRGGVQQRRRRRRRSYVESSSLHEKEEKGERKKKSKSCVEASTHAAEIRERATPRLQPSLIVYPSLTYREHRGEARGKISH